MLIEQQRKSDFWNSSYNGLLVYHHLFTISPRDEEIKHQQSSSSNFSVLLADVNEFCQGLPHPDQISGLLANYPDSLLHWV